MNEAEAIHYLTHDQETDEDTGHLRVPCSRWGRNGAECAPVAWDLHLIYCEANGAPDDERESLDFYMGLVVNDHDDVASLIREHGTAEQLERYRDEIGGRFVAIINVPGYMPMDDDPATFDTAQEAWDYLADERTNAEDDFEGEAYSDTRELLAALGEQAHWRHQEAAEWLAGNGLAADGTGTVYGDTPGYEGEHDLGLAYSVQLND